MNLKKIFYTFSILCILALSFSPFFAAKTSAAINKQIHYQGVLRTLAGALVSDTSYNMVFKFYTASSGGSPIWTGTYTSGNGNAVSTTNGVFSVLLGSGTGNTLNSVDFNQDTLYLGITVGTDSEMSPRQRLGTAATAINSSLLNGLTSDQFLRSDATNSTITVSGTGYFDTASTTNLTISGISGCSGTSALTTNSSGVVSCGAISGGGGAFPFTPTTNFGVNTSATSTALWAQNGIFASSTSRFVYASTTALTVSGAGYFNTGAFSSTISAVNSITVDDLGGGSARLNLTLDAGATGNGSVILDNGGDLTVSSGALINLNPGSSGLKVNSPTSYFSGNVGVGTTSPYAKLSVVGQVVGAYFTATTSTASVFPYASTTALSSSGSAFFATAGGKVSVGATTSPWAQFSINADGNSGPSFAIGSSTATNFVVTNGGLVGVNISNPTAGMFQVVATSSSAIAAKFGNSTIIRNDGLILWGGSADAGVFSWDTGVAVLGAQSGKSLVFTIGSNSGSVSSEKVRIDTSGNLGIGNSSPTEKLTVAGNILSTGTTTTATLDFGQFKQRRAVIEGDSISDTFTSSGDWPTHLASSSPYFKSATTTNYAVAGESTSQMVSEYATEAHTKRPLVAGDDNWFFLYAGINDFSSCGGSAATSYDNLKTLWANAKTDGYKVVAFTILYSTSWDGIDCGDGHGTVTPRDWKIDALNDLIRSDASLYDYLVDTATVLNPRTDASDFSDGTHPSAQGAQIIADLVGRTIEKVSPYLLSSAMSTSTAPTSWNMQLNPTGGVSVGTSTVIASTSLFTVAATSSRTYALNVLNSSAGSAFSILSTGNVGIGTTSPYAKLSVVGQVVSNYFTATSSTIASTFPQASTTMLTVSGTAYMGTASTTNLTVSGISSCSGTSALTTNASGVVACGAITVGAAFPFTPTTNFSVTTSATSTPIWAQGGLYASSTSYFPIGAWGSNGNVSIGSSTVFTGVGGVLLSLEASSSDIVTTGVKETTSSLGSAVLSLYNPATALNGVGALLTFDTNFSNGKTSRAYIKGGSERVSGNAGGFLSFGTNVESPSNSMNEAMRIDRYQNIGIGSTSPWGLLSVNANGLTSTVGAPQFVVGSSTATNFIVANGGNVGVGTTSPFAKFSVAGAGYFTSTLNAITSMTITNSGTSHSTAALNINVGNSDGTAILSMLSGGVTNSALVWDGGTLSLGGAIVIGDTLSVDGLVTLNGIGGAGDVNYHAVCINGSNELVDTGGNTCTLSALRFKENIKDLVANDTFSKLMRLRAVSFDYKNGYYEKNEGAGSYGLIAEEVEKVDPLLVDYCTDGRACTLHFEKFTGLFLKAIQEMHTTLDTLVTKVTGFADTFTTKKLCVEDVCVTKDQFQKLINNSNNNTNTNTGGGGGAGGGGGGTTGSGDSGGGDNGGGSGGGDDGGDNSGKDTSTIGDTSIDSSLGGDTSSSGAAADTGSGDSVAPAGSGGDASTN